MNFLQHLECLFLGGKPTVLFTKAIDLTSPVYYKRIPDSEDFAYNLKPISNVKYYNVPELPLEFVEQVPTDEEDKTKIFLSKFKTTIDKIFTFIPYKHKTLSKGQDKEIFEKYLRDVFKGAGLEAPSYDETLLEPNYCIRNGIFYSFLKQISTNQYTIDFTHYSKYEFKKGINPILKANLAMKDGILVFQSISRFDKGLKLIEEIPADGSDKFIRIRADLYSTAFFELTALQHLLGCHFLAGFNLNVGVRLLSKENPLKQFLWNFVFGTMNINSQIDSLIGKSIGIVITRSPFTENSFYDYIRDSANSYDFSVIFDPKPAISSEMCDDLKNIKATLCSNISHVLEYSNNNLEYKTENENMFIFLRSKIKTLKDKTDLEILTSLVYAASAYHEVVGNNSLPLRSQAILSNYSVTKYNYIAEMLLMVITAIPIRKITAHDVEPTIKDRVAKEVYLNMVRELLDYETSMVYSDHKFLRIKPSNLEAAVQV